MDQPTDKYWNLRLHDVQKNLEKNNFDAYVVHSSADAKDLIMNEILPELGAKTVGFGGSLTLKQTGVYDALCKHKDLEAMRSDLPELTAEEKIEVRRQSLLSDVFFTGVNALTEDGNLVNLDMIGNRVAALTFGPKDVVVVVGRNKLTLDVEAAMERVKNYCSPVNAMRLDMKTPCAKTSECVDCQTPSRICNTWTITEKSFPKKRVKVVLVNEELGF